MHLSTVQLAEILGKLNSYGSTPADFIITILDGVVDHMDYGAHCDNILQNPTRFLGL
jgi:hypothetical protein